MSVRIHRRSGLVGFAGLIALVIAPPALASTYVPNRTGDHAPNGCTRHDCTLREAVIKANKHPGADKIVLRPRRTYNLSIPNAGGVGEDKAATGDLDLLGSVRITHSGKKRPTIDAHSIDGVFQFPATAPTPTGRLAGLVIRGGSAHDGAGVDVLNGHLVLSNAVVRANSAFSIGGGIFAERPGSLRISNSKVSGNSAMDAGGGIWTDDPTSIRRSSVSGNGSGSGGGIADYYRLTVIASTIAGNHATGFEGGGVDQSGVATLVNDTITKNTAGTRGGGIDSNFSTATTSLNAVTIARNTSSGNGGGIESEDGVFKVKNSLIALNSTTGGIGPDCHQENANSLVPQGHTLIGSTSACAGIFGSATHDITDVAPKLGQLAHHGGPTKTIPLLRHSPAINHAQKSTSPSRDQRGVKRGRHPDIGAFERR